MELTPNPKQEVPNYVTKRYFSKVPGSHYTFPDGHQIHFHHGRFDFDSRDFPGEFVGAVVNGKDHPLTGRPLWKVYFDELEYLVTSGNPLVFQQGTLPVDSILPDRLDPRKNAQSEQQIQQTDAKMRATGNITEYGEPNKATGTTGPTDVNSSAIDKDLQEALLKPKQVGPGAARAEQLRAEREAKIQTQAAQNSTGMG